MVVFTHTLPVNDPSLPEYPEVRRDELWESLVHKAAHPVSYVPSITSAELLEEFDGGFVRRIMLRGDSTMPLRERVTLEQSSRIVFTQLDNPLLTEITNEIGEDAEGRLTFTFTATLSAAGLERSRREAGFVAENDLLFYDTAAATVNTVRLTAGRTVAPA
ncbi:SRPBCC family protein [Streptomyces sp. NRRL F-5126]|uniref:SRPBCC family protein n=1 Tax=Streptomyces sp. NRRL F-5126 TaxID=1463857 RepID=UPI0004C69F6B|nr:SRPBCC family protein [Streptomyces sp. NRRL F-5126]